MRTTLVMLMALILTACSSLPAGSPNPGSRSCDRNGDEGQRRAC